MNFSAQLISQFTKCASLFELNFYWIFKGPSGLQRDVADSDVISVDEPSTSRVGT